jgi:hypothetical protein
VESTRGLRQRLTVSLISIRLRPQSLKTSCPLDVQSRIDPAMNECSEEYPDRNFPYPFYFNGEVMPKWAAYWMGCRIIEAAKVVMEDWDERIGWQDLWITFCMIDHLEVIESEDPLRFKICVLVLLKVLDAMPPSVRLAIKEFAAREEVHSREIYRDVHDGLVKMLELVDRDGIAFWTSGYEKDRLWLIEAMARNRLPKGHALYFEAPHIEDDRREALRRIKFLQGYP